MYIRKKEIKDKKSGKIYSYYKLVETLQSANGPRQRVILHLGKLDITDDERKILGKLIERRIAGKQETIKFPKLESITVKAVQKYNEKIALEAERAEEESNANYVEIDLSSTDQTYYRSVGRELIFEEFCKDYNLTAY